MASSSLQNVLRYARRLAVASQMAATVDADLLQLFALSQDERAFAVLVQRHGSMVWGVCRRLLENIQDAEDCFQAVFLVLARKAHTLRAGDALGGWLHRVACRLALRSRAMAARRRTEERQAAAMNSGSYEAKDAWPELRGLLDQELEQLPKAFRVPLVLCYLEGKSNAQAAKELGLPLGTVKGRLARGRELLRVRFEKRGLTLTAGALGVILTEQAASAAAPGMLLVSIASAAKAFAAGKAVSIPDRVLILANGLLHAATLGTIAKSALIAGFLGFATYGGVQLAGAIQLPGSADDGTSRQIAKKEGQKSSPVIVENPAEAPEQRKDFYGDPLPEGAIARMGTTQLRHESLDIGFSADGKTLISPGFDLAIKSWDVATGQLLRSPALPAEKVIERRNLNGSDARLSPDGKILAVFGKDVLSLFDPTTARAIREFQIPTQGLHRMLAFSREGQSAAAATGVADNYLICLWDLVSGEQRFKVGGIGYVHSLLLSGDGKLLAAVGGPKPTLRIWDVTTNQLLRNGPIDGACWAFSPDGKTLASAGLGGTIKLWDSQTLKQIALLKPGPGIAGKTMSKPVLAFSPDGSSLAIAGLEELVVWDVAARKERRRLPDRGASKMTFAPDGKTLACAGQFRIRLWDVDRGTPLIARAGHDNWVSEIAVSPDGKIVASVVHVDPVVHLWDAASGQPLPSLPKQTGWLRSCAFSPEGHLLRAAGDGTIRLLETSDGTELRQFVVEDPKFGRTNNEVWISQLSHDGKRLAAVSENYGKEGDNERPRQLTEWDATTGKLLVRRPFGGNITSSFSPDGGQVSVDVRGRLSIQETATGRERLVIPGDLGFPVVYSPDGNLLAVGIHQTHDENSYQPLGIRMVEVATGDELFHVNGWISYVAFTADGRALATIEDDALRVRDAVTGTELFHRVWPQDFGLNRKISPSRLTFPFHSLALLPDGRAAITGLRDGTILVWDLERPTWPTSKAASNSVDRKDLDALWADLAGDPSKAQQAVRALAGAPAQALPYLAERMRSVAVVDSKHVEKLVGDLDSKQFAVRDDANRALTELGEQIEPTLRKVLEGKPSSEVRTRVDAILSGLKANPPASTKRILRALPLLQRDGTPRAQQVLREMASGAPGARETEEAKRALSSRR